MPRVHFLCTGNYYRSRFAELLFNWLAKEQGLAWHADSSGLEPSPLNSGPISHHTLRGLKQLGVPLAAEHRFPKLTEEQDFAGASLVIAVKEAEHRQLMLRLFPHLLDLVRFWHVHDLDCSEPKETLAHLQREVLALVDSLASQANEAAYRGRHASGERQLSPAEKK